ncbi:hypothetical protein SteCoe_31195 [Stentor coeruleus]|uniref:Acid phosphatase n=1 Tax=Stentor coeruleus TaxID=5963 RepID=A0A1R2B1X6_9CILI|nr:hypothetical protein SteCoe_31195 [Stentor coeruleus]
MFICLLIIKAIAIPVYFVAVTRHGARSPIDFMQWDHAENWPNGEGQLTAEGFRQEYLIGQYLHDRYIAKNQLLSLKYDESEITFYSSNAPRTIQSASAIAYGLYPTNRNMVSKPKYLPPLNINTTSLKDSIYSIDISEFIQIHTSYQVIDPILRPDKTCQEYISHIERMKNSQTMKKIFYKYPEVVEGIKKYFNVDDRKAFDLFLKVHDSVISNEFMGFKVPDEFDAKWLEKAEVAHVEMKYFKLYEPDYVARFVGSKFLNELSKLFSDAVDGKKKSKGVVYSAHDTTIMNILSSLRYKVDKLPEFGSLLLFELDKTQDRYSVNVIYNGENIPISELQVNPDFSEFLSYINMRALKDPALGCALIGKLTKISVKTEGDNDIFYLLVGDLIILLGVIGGIYYLISKIHK